MKWKIIIAMLCLAILLSIPCQAWQVDPELSDEQITELAEEAYIYGLQLAVFYETRYVYTQLKSSQVYEGVNQLNWLRKPITTKFKELGTPEASTLSGAGFFDLSKEPLVVEIPAIQDRYYSFKTMDQYGDFFFYAGKTFTGTNAQNYIITGPSWKGTIPSIFEGAEIVQSPTDSGFMIVRFALKCYTDNEFSTINGYQNRLMTTPLSMWLDNGMWGVRNDKRTKVRASFKTFPRMWQLTKAVVENQTAMDYFQLLSLALNDSTMTKRTDSYKEIQTLVRLAKIGLAQGIIFDPVTISDTHKKLMERGFLSGRQKVEEAAKAKLLPMNGWMIPSRMGNLGTDYLTRAVIAYAGWAGPEAKSYTEAFCFTDSKEQQLDSQKKYTLTFDMRKLPLVSQFWSITMYDSEGYLVDNVMNRYTVNSFMLGRCVFYVDPVGELTFYIQKKRPRDRYKRRNWLPAPEGNFRLTARFFGPYAPLIYGNYDMPRPVRVK